MLLKNQIKKIGKINNLFNRNDMKIKMISSYKNKMKKLNINQKLKKNSVNWKKKINNLKLKKVEQKQGKHLHKIPKLLRKK